MHPLGYSTGAIALGDVREALQFMAPLDLPVIEVSALRLHELEPLVAGIEDLPLAAFQQVTIHLPSRYEVADEPRVAAAARQLADRGLPVVIHPDVMHDFALWRALGDKLFVENMDKRKPIGRTYAELVTILQKLPDARICFDIGHALQVDPSQVESLRILKGLGDRIAWMHLSEVTSSSRHERMSYGALLAFRWLVPFLPPGTPAVIEAAVAGPDIAAELKAMDEAMNCVHAAHTGEALA